MLLLFWLHLLFVIVDTTIVNVDTWLAGNVQLKNRTGSVAVIIALLRLRRLLLVIVSLLLILFKQIPLSEPLIDPQRPGIHAICFGSDSR